MPLDAFAAHCLRLRPTLFIVLGSGQGLIGARVAGGVWGPFAEVPGMPPASVAGHKGCFTVGTLAGTLTTVSFVPQVIKIWRSRSASDISFGMFTLFSLGVLLWLLYGAAIHSLPIVFSNGITLTLSLSIIAMKLRFDRTPA